MQCESVPLLFGPTNEKDTVRISADADAFFWSCSTEKHIPCRPASHIMGQGMDPFIRPSEGRSVFARKSSAQARKLNFQPFAISTKDCR